MGEVINMKLLPKPEEDGEEITEKIVFSNPNTDDRLAVFIADDASHRLKELKKAGMKRPDTSWIWTAKDYIEARYVLESAAIMPLDIVFLDPFMCPGVNITSEESDGLKILRYFQHLAYCQRPRIMFFTTWWKEECTPFVKENIEKYSIPTFIFPWAQNLQGEALEELLSEIPGVDMEEGENLLLDEIKNITEEDMEEAL